MKMNDNSLVRAASGPVKPTLAAVALSATLLALASCSSSGPSSSSSSSAAATQAANAGNFTTTVFLGDSLTAGYQNGSLLDSAEVHGWAPLVAAQVKFPIVQALIAPPGAPGVLQLESLGPPPVITATPGTTTGRDNAAVQVTDLAVPGAEVNDIANTVPLVSPTTGEQQITQLVLGFPGLGLGQAYSQATFAINAKPTTIFLWIGNNDALVADVTGMPSSMTSVADFTTQYTALIKELTTKTTAHLIIGNIPDVTIAPYLQPAATILAEYSAATSLPAAELSVLFGITAGDFVNPQGLGEISAILAGTQKTPISDAGVLSAAEVVQVQAQVAAFNQVIAAQVKASGATMVDTNAIIGQAATGLTISGYTANNAFLNGFFSIDGIHPTNTGYAVIANGFIDAMNAAFKTSVADVDLAAVAATDPLWPPNFAPKSGARPSAGLMALPWSAARSLNGILVPDRLRK